MRFQTLRFWIAANQYGEALQASWRNRNQGSGVLRPES